MTYTLQMVPTFLLYDALSWCIKHKQNHARFYQTYEGSRTELKATPIEIHTELQARKDESFTRLCVVCGEPADGRCYFVSYQQLCPSCYWNTLKSLYVNPVNPAPQTPKVTPSNLIEMPKKSQEKVSLQETEEDIAERLGVSVEVLRETGYFD